MHKYMPIIGLEIHVELSTKSKMFCQCNADYFGAKPNTHVCPVCMGMPGALPVPNKQAIEWAIIIGKALNCTTNAISKFDRKHYFYPDLPKGYQISQYDEPFSVNGYLMAAGKKFRIRRVHLEEDTGKLGHSGSHTRIDFNRSSVPLVEIVTEADFRNSDDVKAFLEELQVVIRYLGVSDADMEKGSMRLEPNISILELTDKTRQYETEIIPDEMLPAYKVEVKNINSFRFVKMAVDFEVERHTEILEKGEVPAQETRGFDDTRNITYAQRTKENAMDYRYFPEPDIPPIIFTETELEAIAQKLPELPAQKMERYTSDLKIKQQDAFILTRNHQTAAYFDEVIAKTGDKSAAQKVANAIINKKISTELSPAEFIKEFHKHQAPKETDTALLDETVGKILAANEKVVADYKAGKQNAVMFLVGQVMREMKGKADANTVKEALVKKLG